MQRLELFSAPERAVVAIGCFDGVHVAHRTLLSETVSYAAAHGLAPAVFSFRGALPHKGDRLQSEEARLAAFRESGIARVFLADFSEVSMLSPEAFIEDVLKKTCNAAVAVCGEGFRFGKDAVGDAALLSERMTAVVVPSVTDGGVAVSSTRVREALSEGRPEEAARLLGAPYTLVGEVLHGKALGREYGIPTANMPFPEGSCIPKRGVYVTRVTVDGETYGAVTNVGVRPTVEADAAVNCESHVIGYRGDLYGKTVTVQFYRYLREERKFATENALMAQIRSDRKEAEKWLNNAGHS